MDDQQSQFSPAKPLAALKLSCFRGGRMVFENLSFKLPPGGLLFLRGRNGTGKSTLLRLVAGFVPAREGSLSYDGEEWDRGDAAIAEAILYAGHDNALKPVMTLRENAQELARLMTGHSVADERLEQAAEVFSLTGLLDQPVRYFSSGQRHRSSLMRFAFINRPLWLMDEPTVGLDTENRRALADLMKAHLASGGSILAATHDPIGVEGEVLDLGAYQPAPIEDFDEEAWV